MIRTTGNCGPIPFCVSVLGTAVWFGSGFDPFLENHLPLLSVMVGITHRGVEMRMKFGSALMVVTLTAVACGGSEGEGGDATQPPGVSITIEDFDFGDPLSAVVGETVTVTNADGVPHTWTSTEDFFDSGSLGGGDSFSFTFEEAGDYSFFCSIHPSMTGSITVSG